MKRGGGRGMPKSLLACNTDTGCISHSSRIVRYWPTTITGEISSATRSDSGMRP